MIFYDWMSEGWCDTEDDDFFVDMTPEGGVDPESYETREEFYNDGFEYVREDPDRYAYKRM